MNIDFYILAFSAVTVLATIWMGFRSAKKSKTASDFFVAGRSVGVGMNASAISGEYLSAASFMGIAGMVMSSGYDALWYPVCYACGYLFLLLFIAGPLRRFGAYTIPDFAEGRFDSPVFRKIAVVFVLFIGFFYTMPQMKGAGTTLAYIFPGLPYWAGVVLVGAVITLNVALGGMKGITLVQAFQYWAKMFAISVPIFVLMAVYGHYGKQVGVNGKSATFTLKAQFEYLSIRKPEAKVEPTPTWKLRALSVLPDAISRRLNQKDVARYGLPQTTGTRYSSPSIQLFSLLHTFSSVTGKEVKVAGFSTQEAIGKILPFTTNHLVGSRFVAVAMEILQTNGVVLVFEDAREVRFAATNALLIAEATDAKVRQPLPAKAPSDFTWLNPFGPLTTKAAKNAAAAIGKKTAAANSSAKENFFESIARTTAVNGNSNPLVLKANELKDDVSRKFGLGNSSTPFGDMSVLSALHLLAEKNHGLHRLLMAESAWPFINKTNLIYVTATDSLPKREQEMRATFRSNGVDVIVTPSALVVVPAAKHAEYEAAYKRDGMAAFEPDVSSRRAQGISSVSQIPLRAGLSPEQRMTVNLDAPTIAQALAVYAELTGRQLVPNTNSLPERVDDLLGGKLSKLKIISRAPAPDNGVREHGDGALTAAEVKSAIEAQLRTNGIVLVAVGEQAFAAQRAPGLPGSGLAQTSASEYSTPSNRQDAGGTLAADAQKAWLDKHEKPLALLYTYSLIIAIVCGTAGLPHILVRFYTNPDGTAAKKTTMWVMILIGVFYVFPPVFGVFGRNLLPELYAATGAKGTDKIVLELPRLLNERYAPLGSVLSGITCAGAFAAFMSTFSGLLVSMTGALAHDVYGRILRPKATAEQRMRMFKIGAVIIGAVAILLGMQVEQLQINFMVGQAFAIAAASYFPLLFMAVWWRKLTMKGAATGMLTGGLAALICISLTSFSDLATTPKASWFFQLFAGLNPFWAAHPLLRILAEQPAIWAVPLAISLMIIVSKLTARDLPADIRMKMLVLHAPEQLGLKQEYIQEHQHGH